MPGKNKIEKDPASGKPVLRDIVSKKPRPALPPRITKQVFPETPITIRKEEKKKIPFKIKIGKWFYIAGVIVITFFIAALATRAFSRAEIILTPRQEFIDAEEALGASADSIEDLSLEAVTLEDEITESGPTETSKDGEGKSSGQVIIYNAFSQTPQVLVANTRLESSGKIFRIKNQVKIPAATSQNGKLIPGSIETTIYAEKPGPDYNIGLADFTIPGFRGTPKYEKFYARSKTAIGGGFSGASKIVTPDSVEALMTKAQESLKNKLREKIARDLPRGIFLPEGAVEIKMELLEVDPPINSQADNFKIKARGTLRALVLEREEISKVLSDKYLNLKESEKTDIANLEKLDVRISGLDFENKKMNVKISGKAHFVWLIDEDSLKNDLLGASKGIREQVFRNYSGIERAEIDFSPGWWRFFPKDKQKIEITTILKENP
ncbi:hypothetical protein HYT00_02980 [Candidatus Giovannonibacteria bacterium]|nr:hypothetical protein [Candidatus Giovannonibacteria bacterium]